MQRVYYFLDAGLDEKERDARHMTPPFRQAIDRLVPALQPGTRLGQGKGVQDDACGLLKENEKRYAEAVRARREKILASGAAFSWNSFDDQAWQVLTSLTLHASTTGALDHGDA